MTTPHRVDAAQVEQVQNRAYDTPTEPHSTPDITVGLETIDTAILNYIQQKIKPTVVQNGALLPVPVIYGTPERWKSAQIDGVLRDDIGKIQLPIIMVQRTGMVKTTSMNSPINKQFEQQFSAEWNRRTPYDRFAVVNGIRPSHAYYITARPDYYDITYQGMIWTEFNSQMNSVVEAISFESDEYWGSVNGYKFRCTIQEFSVDSRLPETEDRVIRTEFRLVAHSYLLPDKMLDYYRRVSPTTRRRYSTKKVVSFIEVDDG